MESLTLSLKEVQKAKGSLECRLNEKRQRRRNIESVLETVNSKLSQVRDIHTKMTETMKIAQHKVAQTQAQSDSMESSNEEKRHTLQSINQQIKDLQDQKTSDMHTFEDELSKMAKQMKNAKDFYTEEKLLEKISESKHVTSQQLQKSNQLDEEIASVTLYLAKLKEQSTSEDTNDNMDKQAVLDIFKREQNDMVKYLENLKAEIESTRNCPQLNTQG
ncbi:uncharacterized protein LOC123553857 [Mercenaria mercenaria]|uniref:uncharacterized protein LOC123553857 n=1 Tax=Mercenaria mercenaria TaxID=6596 RepID=UPI00234E98FD|nr:uncharacterized protein LOC123553857 [Mercenaria mercenaria]